MMLVFDHTPHIKKQIIELIVASHATNTMHGTNYRFIGPQNDPTPYMNMPYKALILLQTW
jgi:hypothetical protein